MAEKLKIIPLGGLNEIGKNITVYECSGELLVVDCGLAFPDDDMYGIDLVIPDITYLKKHENRIRGIVITHGHEDHIGALPYVLKEINVPVYSTRLTAGIIETKLEEHGLLSKVKMRKYAAGDKFKVGKFEVEFIGVNHSIADAVALAIKTPLGTVVHTGDFKLDTTPIAGEMMDITRLGELGQEGVLALLSDSTNVERPGYTISERKIGDSLENLFKNCDKRIIVTTFASNVHRIQQIIDIAAKFGRKVAISGRSMENILNVATNLGYITIPPNVLIELSAINRHAKHKVVLITTGSQGEPMSALYRMAFSGHKQVEIGSGDMVIISASPIPGNEKTISNVINELFKKGAEVVYEKLAEIHVSGHACQEELKLMLALTKPKYFMPVHGEYRHLNAHSNIAKNMGIPANQIFISENGKPLEFSAKGVKFGTPVPAGQVFVDGLGVGDVGSVVLRDRKKLAQDGLIMAVITLNSHTGKLIAGPDIISRGFIYVKEAEELMEGLRKTTADVVVNLNSDRHTDWATIKSAMKSAMSDYLYKKTKRSPMILPVILEVEQ